MLALRSEVEASERALRESEAAAAARLRAVQEEADEKEVKAAEEAAQSAAQAAEESQALAEAAAGAEKSLRAAESQLREREGEWQKQQTALEMELATARTDLGAAEARERAVGRSKRLSAGIKLEKLGEDYDRVMTHACARLCGSSPRPQPAWRVRRTILSELCN